MKIDHIVPSIDISCGGPSRSICMLTDRLAEFPDVDIRILGQNNSDSKPHLSLNNNVNRILPIPTSKLCGYLGLPLARILHTEIQTDLPDIIHSHGVWHPINHLASRFARSNKIPHIIQPRGMLEPWSFQWKKYKKNIAWNFYQKADIDYCSLLIATSEQEAFNLRALGIVKPIAIIPNGIEMRNSYNSSFNKGNFKSGRTVLFISRIHPKKGINLILDAWLQVDTDGWEFLIAGNDDGGYLKDLIEFIETKGKDKNIKYIGSVTDTDKWALYANADIFVLPSFSENFGLVVAEALSQGVPVITTTNTPWSDLEKFGCGWWVDSTKVALMNALKTALSSDQSDLRLMGQRAYNYSKRYDIKNTACMVNELYRWLLGLATKPSFVI